MAHSTPGSLVHYRPTGSLSPHWPAVVCTDDVAPDDFLRTRPNGYTYVTLVLLMGEKLEFRWARTTEMTDYDPFVPFTEEAKVGSTPGLGDAYEIANNALEAGLGLDHWREQVMAPITVSSDSDGAEIDSDEEECSDPELKMAIRASRQDYYGKRPRKRSTGRVTVLPTPSLSPRERARKPGSRFPTANPERTHAAGPFRPSAAAASSPLPGPSGYFRPREGLRAPPLSQEIRPRPLSSDTTIDLTDDTSATPSTEQKTDNPKSFQHTSFLDNTLGGLGRSLKEHTSDTVDGELSESKEFVQIPHGPENDISTLQKRSVWNRSYWLDPRQGVNYFDINEDGIWELQHPALSEIEPKDFVFIAEYLESGDFGHRHPQGGDAMEEALAQCVSVWTTAEALGMFDLMEHVIDKLGGLIEPGLDELLMFADLVYKSPDSDLPAHERMKDYLATNLANNYWIYLEDDHLSSTFIEKMKELPRLERDIYRRRIVALNERLSPEDEEQDDDDIEMG